MDFTSALYLGLTHESETMEWTELTTGAPAALRRSETSTAAAHAFAALVGCERAVALSSTLHAFVDLFTGLAERVADLALVHDEGLYPIARCGLALAERRGAQVVAFRHHDAHALETRLSALARTGCRPWIVTDGFCASCGRPAPLEAYLALARDLGGGLIVDDTQAIGLLGGAPSPTAPLGRGGAGSLASCGLAGAPDVVLVASLAKALGAPVAMLAGTDAFVRAFESRSKTLVHCSPPSEAALAAAVRAIAVNATEGEALRARLLARVQGFRLALAAVGLTTRGGPFPVQRVVVRDVPEAIARRAWLARQGVHAIARRGGCNREASVTFIVTARHREADLRRAAALAAGAWRARGGTKIPSTREA